MSIFHSLLAYLSNVIQFKDINVKQCLLSNSTINSDGTKDITYAEASNPSCTPTVINNAINGNTDIISFKEFKYFPIIQVIPDSFLAGCVSLKEIDFPDFLNNKINFSGGSTCGKLMFNQTAIETLDLNKLTKIAGSFSTSGSKNDSVFGEMLSLKEVYIKNINEIKGCVFYITNTPNIEKIIISSLDQWFAISCDTGVNNYSHAGYNNTPTCSGKASLYIGDNKPSSKVTYLKIPNNVNNIRINALRQLKVSVIEFDHNVTCSAYCFTGLTNETTLIGVDYITSLGEGAFKNCLAKGIKVPNNTSTIGSGAFSNSSITEISSTNLTSIGTRSFENCSSLQTIYINLSDSTKVVSIASPNVLYSPFKNCVNLTTIFINKILNVPSNCFNNCGTQTCTLVGATTLADSAFTNNTKLETFICDTVVSFGNGCFNNCSKLKTITFDLTNAVLIGTDAFANCSRINCPSIFNNLHTIGASAFYNCIIPTDITLPYIDDSDPENLKGVAFIQKNTFAASTNFANPFGKADTNVTIHVPSELLSTWYNSGAWANVKTYAPNLTIVAITN